MPEDLDPITARLVSELSASILPSLTKSLMTAIPSVDISGAVERSNRLTQDLRSEIIKSLRSGIDDSRAGRSMIIQSIGTVLEEISSLRSSVDKLPEILSSIKNELDSNENQNQSKKNNDSFSDELITEINAMSERIDTLTQGIKAFFESYAENQEINSGTANPELIRPVFDSDMLSGLEGLVRAEGKSHSKELAEFSREIEASTEESNSALLHEVREVIAEELSGLGGDNSGRSVNAEGSGRLLKIIAGLSGGCLVLLAVNLILLMMK